MQKRTKDYKLTLQLWYESPLKDETDQLTDPKEMKDPVQLADYRPNLTEARHKRVRPVVPIVLEYLQVV